MKKMACLFCQQDGGSLQLHQFKTLEADKTLRQMTELMARIEGGNLVAYEAKYHLECLTALCNCYRSFKGKVSVQMPSQVQLVMNSRIVTCLHCVERNC